MPEEDRASNFGETVYVRENPSGGAQIQTPVFEMSKGGFAILAMGFTGKRALEFKVAYIDAFNNQ